MNWWVCIIFSKCNNKITENLTFCSIGIFHKFFCLVGMFAIYLIHSCYSLQAAIRGFLLFDEIKYRSFRFQTTYASSDLGPHAVPPPCMPRTSQASNLIKAMPDRWKGSSATKHVANSSNLGIRQILICRVCKSSFCLQPFRGAVEVFYSRYTWFNNSTSKFSTSRS